MSHLAESNAESLQQKFIRAADRAEIPLAGIAPTMLLVSMIRVVQVVGLHGPYAEICQLRFIPPILGFVWLITSLSFPIFSVLNLKATTRHFIAAWYPDRIQVGATSLDTAEVLGRQWLTIDLPALAFSAVVGSMLCLMGWNTADWAAHHANLMAGYPFLASPAVVLKSLVTLEVGLLLLQSIAPFCRRVTRSPQIARWQAESLRQAERDRTQLEILQGKIAERPERSILDAGTVRAGRSVSTDHRPWIISAE